MHAIAALLEPAKPAADAAVLAVAVDDQLFLPVAELAPGFFRRDFFALAVVEQPFGSPFAIDPRPDRAVARDLPGLESPNRDRCR
jgi:hypothetical protein